MTLSLFQVSNQNNVMTRLYQRFKHKSANSILLADVIIIDCYNQVLFKPIVLSRINYTIKLINNFIDSTQFNLIHILKNTFISLRFSMRIDSPAI